MSGRASFARTSRGTSLPLLAALAACSGAEAAAIAAWLDGESVRARRIGSPGRGGR